MGFTVDVTLLVTLDILSDRSGLSETCGRDKTAYDKTDREDCPSGEESKLYHLNSHRDHVSKPKCHSSGSCGPIHRRTAPPSRRQHPEDLRQGTGRERASNETGQKVCQKQEITTLRVLPSTRLAERWTSALDATPLHERRVVTTTRAALLVKIPGLVDDLRGTQLVSCNFQAWDMMFF